MIDQSKGLRAMARIIRVGVFAMYALFVPTMVLGILGQKALTGLLAACVFAIFVVLAVLMVVFVLWSVYDQGRRSKARKVIDDSRRSGLLFTDDSKLTIKGRK